jgi:hypothetical protein
VHQLQLLGKGTSSTRVEHLEALLFERKPNKLHSGSNQQWSGFKDTDGVAIVFHCSHRTQAAKGKANCSTYKFEHIAQANVVISTVCLHMCAQSFSSFSG